MMKVHYERFIGAENFSKMTGRTIPEALHFLYDGEDLTLPERGQDQTVKIERRREWNRRRLEAGGGLLGLHPTFAFVEAGHE